jgi:hypothetical protein
MLGVIPDVVLIEIGPGVSTGHDEPRRSCNMMVEMVETSTDVPGLNEWGIRDEVVQLREWGTSIVHPLPSTRDVSIIGAADGCWLRLWDPTGRVSRKHAELTHSEAGWAISDLRSKNGVHFDGTRLSSSTLIPGVQIRIGGITLIAESPRLCALRELLARFIGWRDEHREDVDQALYSVRIAATQREPLLLCGSGNLVSIAKLLHRHILGDQPFVVCAPRATYTSGVEALAAASGGTLCVWRNKLPADFDEVVAVLRGPEPRVLLVICAHAVPRGGDIASQVVTIFRSILLPPLADRARELNRIIDAYATDAVATFGGWLAPADREWIAGHASDTLSQIEMATRRIVALHACDESVTLAAKQLSMSHGSLSDWLARRTLPGRSQMPPTDEDEE